MFCVKPLKDKKAKTVLHGFVETVNESKHKPNKLWTDQGRKFDYSPMLDDNDILMCLTHYEGKSVVDERFIKKVKGKPIKT